MSYSKKYSFPVLLMVSIALIIISCEKNDRVAPNQGKTVDTERENVQPFSVDPKKVPQVLKEFRESSNVKMREDSTKSLSESVWYIEALSNENHGHANFGHSKIFISKDSIGLGAGPYNMTDSEINQHVNTVSQFVQDALNDVSVMDSAKAVTVIDVYSEDIGSNKQLKVTIGTGVNPENGLSSTEAEEYSIDCEAEDDWYAGFEKGKCDDTQQGMDAADIIKDIINSQNQTYGCQLLLNDYGVAYEGYFANVMTIYTNYRDYPNPNDPPPSGYKDYLLFQTDEYADYGYELCIPEEDVNFYRDGAITIIYDKLNNELQGKEFAMCDIWDDFLLAGYDNLEHRMQVTGGQFVER